MSLTEFSTMPEEAFLRLPQVKRLAGIGRSSVYALIGQGRFPKPVKLTSRASGWRVGEIRRWLNSPATWGQ